MAVEKIDVRVAKGASVPPEDGDNEAYGNDPEVDDFIELSSVGGVNRGLDVTTEWTLFFEPALHIDDEHEESDVMLSLTTVHWNKAG